MAPHKTYQISSGRKGNSHTVSISLVFRKTWIVRYELVHGALLRASGSQIIPEAGPDVILFDAAF